MLRYNNIFGIFSNHKSELLAKTVTPIHNIFVTSLFCIFWYKPFKGVMVMLYRKRGKGFCDGGSFFRQRNSRESFLRVTTSRSCLSKGKIEAKTIAIVLSSKSHGSRFLYILKGTISSFLSNLTKLVVAQEVFFHLV